MKSRKLWGGVILIVIALLFALLKLADEFAKVSEFITMIFGLYVIGNVGEHISKVVKK